jgi:hypothetical protein
MSKKIISPGLKNPDAPMGRKDNIGRTPRWRISLTYPQARILLEVMENFYLDHPDALEDGNYYSLHVRLNEAKNSMDTPLVKNVDDFPLLDQEFKYD